MFNGDFKSALKGLIFGAFFCCLLIAAANATYWMFSDPSSTMLQKFSKVLIGSNLGTENTQNIHPKTIVKEFSSFQTKVPDGFVIDVVNTNQELKRAITRANKNNGQTAIYLQDGNYNLGKTIRIVANDIMFLSVSGNPYKTSISGLGMKQTKGVHNIFEVRADGFVLDGILLTDAPNHLIQIAAEDNASRPIIRNCILQDSYEHMLKVSYDQASRPKNISYDGVVEQCIFQYTHGIAPYYYTGGIDALGAKGWRVENNIFKDIASPSKPKQAHSTTCSTLLGKCL